MANNISGTGLYLPEGYQLQDYRLICVLGKGGFGITYLAEDIRLGRKVAIKEYFPLSFSQRTADGIGVAIIETARTRFQLGLRHFNSEGRILARFRHAGIVGINGYIEANGTAYLVMDFEDGDILPAWMSKKAARLSENQVISLLKFLGEGLSVVHAAGYLHLDIKPANVIIRIDTTPVLIDFGSARYNFGVQTQILALFISPGYSAIEQYSEESVKGPWTDIYSLAAVFYELLIGERPPDAVVRQRRDTMVPAVEAGSGRYSRQLLGCLDWALKVDPSERPQKVEDWLASLGDGKGATPISRDGFKYIKTSYFKRYLIISKSGGLKSGAGIALLLIALSIGMKTLWFREERHPIFVPISAEVATETRVSTPDLEPLSSILVAPILPSVELTPNPTDLVVPKPMPSVVAAADDGVDLPFVPKSKPLLQQHMPGTAIVTDPAPQPTANPPAEHGYFIIAGSFAVTENARETSRILRERGLPVTVVEVMRATKHLYIIKVGPFAERDEAKARASVVESITRERSILVRN
ncbi:MAG: protein kinase [Rhodospirillaceae bacterium]